MRHGVDPASTNMPECKQRMLRRIAKSDPQLAKRRVLVVDDDLRNIFALTSLLEGSLLRVWLYQV
jgi:PleD family two-component response regulator